MVFEGGDSAMFSVPIANPGTVAPESIVADFGSLGVLFTPETHEADATAESVAILTADDLNPDEVGKIALFTMHDLAGAQIAVGPDFLGWQVLVVDLGEGQFMIVELTGALEQFWLATPLVFDALNTLRLEGDKTPIEDIVVIETLDAEYTFTAEQLTFSYPATWETQEQESYTLLITPTGTTIGISGDYPPSPIDEEMLQFIADDFLDCAASIEGVVVQEELTIFAIGEYPAARVMAFDTETFATYSFMAFGLNDELIAIITIIGQTDDVRILQGTILAIADSMTVE